MRVFTGYSGTFLSQFKYFILLIWDPKYTELLGYCLVYGLFYKVTWKKTPDYLKQVCHLSFYQILWYFYQQMFNPVNWRFKINRINGSLFGLWSLYCKVIGKKLPEYPGKACHLTYSNTRLLSSTVKKYCDCKLTTGVPGESVIFLFSIWLIGDSKLKKIGGSLFLLWFMFCKVT